MTSEFPVSARAAKAGNLAVLPYFPQMLQTFADRYDAEKNPNGFIPLLIAENNLSAGMFHERLAAEVAKSPPETERYNIMSGSPDLKAAMSKLLRRIYKFTCEPDGLIITTGVAPTLDYLVWALAESGDGVLVPGPYYPAFEFDLVVRSEAQIVIANALAPTFKLTRECLEKGMADAKERGLRVPVMLLTSPTNPSGTVYTREELSMVLEFCKEHKMHLISNEIYALTVFGPPENKRTFVSVGDVATNGGRDPLPSNVHLTYGLSKDFCVSGLRVVPFPVQWALANMLSDDEWVDSFQANNHKLMAEQREVVVKAFAQVGVECINGGAGIFEFFDLGKFLPERTPKAEWNLFLSIFENTRVAIAPGHSFKTTESGWFRMCYASVPKDQLELAMEKLINYLKSL